MLRTLIAAVLMALVWVPVSVSAADEADSLAGRLLVADEGMRDPRFRESLIYIVRHNEDGAFGIVVNRPLLRIPSAEVFDQLGLDPPAQAAAIDFHYGGPVQSEVGFVLHTNDFLAEGSMSVEGGLSVSGLRAVLVATANDEGPMRAIFALGYSGWGPGQLEGEIARDDWVTVEGDAALVFDVPHDERWREAIARRGLDL